MNEIIKLKEANVANDDEVVFEFELLNFSKILS